MLAEEDILLLRDQVKERIDLQGAVEDGELLRVIEQVVFGWSASRVLTAAGKHQAVRRLYHSFRGLDMLQPLLDDAAVTEIMINGHEEIFIERNGLISRFPQSFESRERLEDLIQSIVGSVNRVVNESSPIVDARLKDGSRIHVVLPPVALKGPTLTIRKFPERQLLMDDLIARGSLTAEAAGLLGRLVEAKYNLFISGGTGTGKTTFLNALSRFIPADERVVTIEDSAELQIRNVPNLVSLEARNANTEGKGAVTIRELIRASLRMRPDRIVVGEVRGGEALDMLQAMNTGHDGSLSTGHANSARDMIARLETMVLSAAELPIPAIRGQIASAIDIMVHLSRLRDGSRRVTEIAEVAGFYDGDVLLNVLYRYEENEEDAGSGLSAVGGLAPTGSGLINTRKWAMAGFHRREVDAQ
ncbi:CpaF family protein [Paenibacillus tarimensis]|uniref:CpaF family protein n=1 Tax=Paenibacillus tarimensis TaxID=416012 RepID=UPI001F30741B|nr:ATPase, T2SS/T4P/T4SS family [Paenibacillus tarimensis]MCF2943539.1 Flp pilus assembly complex ATPase component TadA [Paenibacillus tarimensis]